MAAAVGHTVAGDSPQFSALTAQNAPPQAVGSVLTLANSIGFGISILSIQLFVTLTERHEVRIPRFERAVWALADTIASLSAATAKAAPATLNGAQLAVASSSLAVPTALPQHAP